MAQLEHTTLEYVVYLLLELYLATTPGRSFRETTRLRTEEEVFIILEEYLSGVPKHTNLLFL